MRAAILLAVVAVAYGAPNVSKLQFTPLHSGGGRIVGGTAATPGEFPHQVMMTYGLGGSLRCGGSIYDKNTIITAAHCCDGERPSQLGIYAGRYKTSGGDDGEQGRAVSEIIMHEAYNSFTIENDICMLKLKSSLEFNDKVGAISMPSDHEEYADGTDCIVSGWGTTSSGGSIASTLRKVTVPVVSDQVCREDYGASDVADSMICAGLHEGGKDSCQGDSGGPFMCGNQLSGIVSWGYGCARPDKPGVYTQTSYFIDWINKHA